MEPPCGCFQCSTTVKRRHVTDFMNSHVFYLVSCRQIQKYKTKRLPQQETVLHFILTYDRTHSTLTIVILNVSVDGAAALLVLNSTVLVSPTNASSSTFLSGLSALSESSIGRGSCTMPHGTNPAEGVKRTLKFILLMSLSKLPLTCHWTFDVALTLQLMAAVRITFIFRSDVISPVNVPSSLNFSGIWTWVPPLHWILALGAS